MNWVCASTLGLPLWVMDVMGGFPTCPDGYLPVKDLTTGNWKRSPDDACFICTPYNAVVGPRPDACTISATSTLPVGSGCPSGYAYSPATLNKQACCFKQSSGIKPTYYILPGVPLPSWIMGGGGSTDVLSNIFGDPKIKQWILYGSVGLIAILLFMRARK